jgi:hypothetical protein
MDISKIGSSSHNAHPNSPANQSLPLQHSHQPSVSIDGVHPVLSKSETAQRLAKYLGVSVDALPDLTNKHAGLQLADKGIAAIRQLPLGNVAVIETGLIDQAKSALTGQDETLALIHTAVEAFGADTTAVVETDDGEADYVFVDKNNDTYRVHICFDEHVVSNLTIQDDLGELVSIPLKTQKTSLMYNLQGHKLRLMQHLEASEPILAAVSDPQTLRLVDGFCGTGFYAKWIAMQGKLPPSVVLNELTPFRHFLLDQLFVQGNVEKIVDELRQYGQQLRQLCYETLANVNEISLADWEKKSTFTRKEKLKCSDEVKKFLLREMTAQWPVNAPSPNNSPKVVALYLLIQHSLTQVGAPADIVPIPPDRDNGDATIGLKVQGSGFGFRMLGPPYSTVQSSARINETIDEMAGELRAASDLLSGKVKVTRHNAWLLISLVGKGDFVLVDPPYLLPPGKRPSQTTVYFKGNLPEYSPVGCIEQLAEFAPAWARGAKLHFTNRYDTRLVRYLEKIGLNVSKKIVSSRNMNELIATNFDWDDWRTKGTRMRTMLPGDPEAPWPMQTDEDGEGQHSLLHIETEDNLSRHPIFNVLYRQGIAENEATDETIPMDVDSPTAEDVAKISSSAPVPAVWDKYLPPLDLPLSDTQTWVTRLGSKFQMLSSMSDASDWQIAKQALARLYLLICDLNLEGNKVCWSDLRAGFDPLLKSIAQFRLFLVHLKINSSADITDFVAWPISKQKKAVEAYARGSKSINNYLFPSIYLVTNGSYATVENVVSNSSVKMRNFVDEAKISEYSGASSLTGMKRKEPGISDAASIEQERRQVRRVSTKDPEHNVEQFISDFEKHLGNHVRSSQTIEMTAKMAKKFDDWLRQEGPEFAEWRTSSAGKNMQGSAIYPATNLTRLKMQGDFRRFDTEWQRLMTWRSYQSSGEQFANLISAYLFLSNSDWQIISEFRQHSQLLFREKQKNADGGATIVMTAALTFFRQNQTLSAFKTNRAAFENWAANYPMSRGRGSFMSLERVIADLRLMFFSNIGNEERMTYQSWSDYLDNCRVRANKPLDAKAKELTYPFGIRFFQHISLDGSRPIALDETTYRGKMEQFCQMRSIGIQETVKRTGSPGDLLSKFLFARAVNMGNPNSS